MSTLGDKIEQFQKMGWLTSEQVRERKKMCQGGHFNEQLEALGVDSVIVHRTGKMEWRMWAEADMHKIPDPRVVADLIPVDAAIAKPENNFGKLLGRVKALEETVAQLLAFKAQFDK